MSWKSLVTRLLPVATLIAARAGAPAAGVFDAPRTVAIAARTVGPSDVTEEVLAATVWHALAARGHTPMILSSADDSAGVMAERGVTRLYDIEVSWEPVVVDVGAWQVAPSAPHARLRVYERRGTDLIAGAVREVVGDPAVFQLVGLDDAGVVALPQVAVQATVGALFADEPTRSRTRAPDTVDLDVEVAADEEYRKFYGHLWQAAVRQRIDRANVLLAGAGVRLRVVQWSAWRSDDAAEGLDALLDDLVATPRHPGSSLRVAFSQQHDLAERLDELEEVGRAWRPGSDVVVADQAGPPGHGAEWDVAEEGIAVAHEVLHALGVPHALGRDLLMSETKSGLVAEVDGSTAILARAAAQARSGRWASATALAALGDVSDRHLVDPGAQLDFIAENLVLGPGVPEPGSVDPSAVSALTNLALGRYYFTQADRDPARADLLRARARAHAAAALSQRPAVVEVPAVQRLVDRLRLDD
jgi:hypothetical protein